MISLTIGEMKQYTFSPVGNLNFDEDALSKFFGFCSSHFAKWNSRKLTFSSQTGWELYHVCPIDWLEVSLSLLDRRPLESPMVLQLPSAQPSSIPSLLSPGWKKPGRDTGLSWPSTATQEVSKNNWKSVKTNLFCYRKTWWRKAYAIARSRLIAASSLCCILLMISSMVSGPPHHSTC